MHRSFILIAVLWTVPAAAQPAAPVAAAEFVIGWAGFIDEALIDHAVAGGSARFHVTPRVSLGPEVIYMRGPGFDRDFFLTGNVTFDFLTRPQGSRAGTISPFVVGGAGLMIFMDRFPSGTFTSYEGALTGGGGARIWITDRLYALAELRLGWEPHSRINGGIGMTW